MIIKFCFILTELIFCLGCKKDKKNITKLLTDAKRDLKTYATAVSNFEIEKQRAKNDSNLALQRVNDLLSTCQTDFSNLTQICQDWENGVSEQSKTLAKRIF